MISVADFQPLSITRINIFHRQPRFYRQIYHSSVDYLRHAITSRNLSLKKIVWRVFLWQHFYIVIFIFIAYCFVSQLIFIRLFRISLSSCPVLFAGSLCMWACVFPGSEVSKIARQLLYVLLIGCRYKDGYSSCPSWAGHCKGGRWQSFMLKYCKETCFCKGT